MSRLHLLWSLPDLQHWSDDQYQVPSWPTASPFCILSVACGNKDGSSFANTVSNLGRIEKGAKIYFGSSFKGFSPLVAWPCPHRLVLLHIIMARECKAAQSFVEAKKQRGLAFVWPPLPRNPPNYESISGLIHRGGQSSRDPVAPPLKTWVLGTELPIHVTLRDI